ncbi:hypothetical protein D3C87_1468930 [compost metagenome]
MLLPVSPPMKPVATTGAPKALRTRATLMPLPPGSAGMVLTSLTALSLKPDTTAVRSMAALGVTVTITGAPGDGKVRGLGAPRKTDAPLSS